MKTTARKMFIFVLAVATTTTLTLGTSTALAASNTHTHHLSQLKNNGDDWFPTSTVSNTHTHHHNMQQMSSNANHLTGTNSINSIGSRNNDFSTNWPGSFSPTQYGSTVSHSHQHHSPTADINSANRGLGGNEDFSNRWANGN